MMMLRPWLRDYEAFVLVAPISDWHPVLCSSLRFIRLLPSPVGMIQIFFPNFNGVHFSS